VNEVDRIWKIVVNYWPKFLEGLGVTLEMTLIAVVIGFIIGVILAIARVYGNKLFYGLPPLGMNLSPFAAAIIGFAINSGCYQAEYLRGSIQSISGNQMKAARSLGMTKWQAILQIIMPQAFRRVIPAWTNEFIYLLKYTSLAYIVGAPELMAQAKFIASRNFQFFEVYLVVAVIYLVVVLFFTKIFSILEKKVEIPGLEWVR
jgi:polar amino acid transport system permease protein